MAYHAVDEIMTRCEKDGVEFWKAVQFEDCEERRVLEADDFNVDKNERKCGGI